MFERTYEKRETEQKRRIKNGVKSVERTAARAGWKGAASADDLKIDYLIHITVAYVPARLFAKLERREMVERALGNLKAFLEP